MMRDVKQNFGLDVADAASSQGSSHTMSSVLVYSL